MFRTVGLIAVAGVLASCATPYQPSGLLGGFDAKQLREDVYRVNFGGNGYTTAETAQTYWLYECANLTLEKGYYGFEILSDMKFIMRRLPDDGVKRAFIRHNVATDHLMNISASAEELAIATRLQPGGSGGTSRLFEGSESVRVATGAPVFVYIPTSRPNTPVFEGDIHLLKQPFEPAPPKTFAAAALKAALQGYVTSDKCGLGNVCAHVHDYLLPKGKLLPR